MKLVILLTALIGHYVLGQFTQVPSGTSENLTGIWMDEASPFGVIVGNAGTILHWDGMDWNAVNSTTSQNLYDVHGLSATDVVASGQGLVLHWDGLSWSQVIDIPNTPITPVLLTSDRIWYGIPDSQFPIIGRCDRMGQGCLGLVSSVGLVLAMQQHISGDIFFIGTNGSVGRHDESLMNFMYVHEQPVGDLLSLTAASIQLADPVQQKAKRVGENLFIGGDSTSILLLLGGPWERECTTDFEVISVFDFFAGGDDGGAGIILLDDSCNEEALSEPVTDIAVTSELFQFYAQEQTTLTQLLGVINTRRNCRPFWEMFDVGTTLSYVDAINCDGP